MKFELIEHTKTANTKSFIISTEQSRKICNDPAVAGFNYTKLLTEAGVQALRALHESKAIDLKEDETTVLNVLRGGLNFGLREALAEAFGWNNHSSAFISAQRARKDPHSPEWIITESSYKKIYLKPFSSVVFGDVVATGTSLKFALERLVANAEESGCEIKSLLFFTIGGPNSFSIVDELAAACRKRFPGFTGACVVYFEGEFAMATNDSPLSIKIDGTDLLRRDCAMAPAFTASQYDKPTYPLERCTIYDAGSRSFDVAEYWHDVREYWEQTLELANGGMTFQKLLAERAPQLDAQRFGQINLRALCIEHLESFPNGIRSKGHVAE